MARTLQTTVLYCLSSYKNRLLASPLDPRPQSLISQNPESNIQNCLPEYKKKLQNNKVYIIKALQTAPDPSSPPAPSPRNFDPLGLPPHAGGEPGPGQLHPLTPLSEAVPQPSSAHREPFLLIRVTIIIRRPRLPLTAAAAVPRPRLFRSCRLLLLIAVCLRFLRVRTYLAHCGSRPGSSKRSGFDEDQTHVFTSHSS